MGASPYTGNRGVSALSASLTKLVWQIRPEATISLLIGHRAPHHTTCHMEGRLKSIETINYRLSPRAALRQQLWWILLMSFVYRVIPWTHARNMIVRTSPWIRTVSLAHFVGDIRGGDSFSDIYGLSRFLLGSLPVLSVIWIRGSVHLLPQTYGPFRSRVARKLAQYILLRAGSIWCRDRRSLQEVSHLTDGRRTGALCPDVAFALEAITPDPPEFDSTLGDFKGELIVGLNVNGLMYHGGYTRANMFGLTLDYRTFLERFVERLLTTTHSRLLLIPHEYAAAGEVGSDQEACRAVIQKLPPSLRHRVRLVTSEYDQHHIKGIIGMCHFFVGSRMHACIAALSQGIPTVAIAYSPKFFGVFDLLDAGDWVIDAQTECIDNALERVDNLFNVREESRTNLMPRLAALHSELAQTFAHIFCCDTPAAPQHHRCPFPL